MLLCLISIDNHHFLLSDVTDGVLINRISKNQSGMYLCVAKIPLPERFMTAFYPVMVFVSDPLCENVFLLFSLYLIILSLFFLSRKEA